jgi:hypothetical protein
LPSSLLQLIECIYHRKGLHRADGIQHMGIMTWRRAEAAVVMLTRQDEVDGCVAREGVRSSQQV